MPAQTESGSRQSQRAKRAARNRTLTWWSNKVFAAPDRVNCRRVTNPEADNVQRLDADTPQELRKSFQYLYTQRSNPQAI